MMMIHYNQNHTPSHHIQHPTIEIPQWDPPYDDPTTGASPTTTATLFSPQTNDYFRALQRYLPSSSNEYDLDDPDLDSDDPDSFNSFDSFSCDEFRMYEFKVRKCARGRSHDWTECPYAHPGEKARRRDPRRYHYSGTACPEFRRGSCRKGDACEYAHGVFECWLHPARYRTQPCKDGPNCKRRVCFFAHSPDQLRVLPHSPESPPSRLSESPPSELIEAMRGLRVGGGGGGGLSMSPRLVGSGSGFGSPRSPGGFGYFGGGGGGGGGSVPSTPTRTPTGRAGIGLFDPWEMTSLEEEVPMERVESGKDLRARIYAKLSKENSLDGDRVDPASSAVPDFGWVSELVK